MKSSSVIGIGIIGTIVSIVIYGAFIFGGIYFVFWSLKHFNIIGG